MISLRALFFGLYITEGSHHYSLPMSQQKGEEQLYNLAETSQIEESWYFVEFQNGRTRWYESGIHQSEHQVELDPRVRARLLKRNSIQKIIRYHIHPTRDRNITWGPSHFDLMSSLGAQFNSDIEYESRIVEPSGIFTIHSTRTESLLKSLDILTVIVGLPDSMENTTSEEYAQSLSTESIKIKFIPRTN